MLFALLGAIGFLAGVGCTRDPEPSSTATATRHFQEVSVEQLAKHPWEFDEARVRVRGIADLQFEGTSLHQEPPSTRYARHAVSLHLGWPLPPDLRAMDGKTIVVEGRFDADERGHEGMYAGALADVRALWQIGDEHEPLRLNYETRSDALEQLEFRTAWAVVGFLDPDGELQLGDGSTVATSIPRAGDRLRPTRRLRLQIKDYGVTGEALRLEVPTDQNDQDLTRLWLAAGTLVQVEEVRVGTEPARFVWVRLSPVPVSSDLIEPVPTPPPPPAPPKRDPSGPKR